MLIENFSNKMINKTRFSFTRSNEDNSMYFLLK